MICVLFLLLLLLMTGCSYALRVSASEFLRLIMGLMYMIFCFSEIRLYNVYSSIYKFGVFIYI